MPKKEAGATRVKRKCPHCQKIKFKAIKEEVSGVPFILLVCDNDDCKRVLGGGPAPAS